MEDEIYSYFFIHIFSGELGPMVGYRHSTQAQRSDRVIDRYDSSLILDYRSSESPLLVRGKIQTLIIQSIPVLLTR